MKQSWSWLRRLSRRHGTSSDATGNSATTGAAVPTASAACLNHRGGTGRHRSRRPALATTPNARPASESRISAELLTRIGLWVVLVAVLATIAVMLW